MLRDKRILFPGVFVKLEMTAFGNLYDPIYRLGEASSHCSWAAHIHMVIVFDQGPPAIIYIRIIIDVWINPDFRGIFPMKQLV